MFSVVHMNFCFNHTGSVSTSLTPWNPLLCPLPKLPTHCVRYTDGSCGSRPPRASPVRRQTGAMRRKGSTTEKPDVPRTRASDEETELSYRKRESGDGAGSLLEEVKPLVMLGVLTQPLLLGKPRTPQKRPQRWDQLAAGSLEDSLGAWRQQSERGQCSLGTATPIARKCI